jgi:hypothetical protein
MALKFRILLRPIETSDTVSDFIVKAIVVLHNYLLDYSQPCYHPARYADHEDEDGLWRRHVNPLEQATEAIRQIGANNRAQRAAEIREKFADLFSIGVE